MKDKEVGFASWFDDMNRGCTCVGYLSNSGCRLNNATMNIVNLSPDFEEASFIHSLNAIKSQIM